MRAYFLKICITLFKRKTVKKGKKKSQIKQISTRCCCVNLHKEIEEEQQFQPSVTSKEDRVQSGKKTTGGIGFYDEY